MGDNRLGILFHVAKEGGLYNTYKTTTNEIAKAINLSQQSASRILKEMENEGLISRDVYIDGQNIVLNEPAIALLRENYSILKNLFEKKPMKIDGVVKTGIAEGRYYIGLKGYQKEFKSKLGFLPYPGTLNLETKQKRPNLDYKEIKGFKTKKRSYGGLKFYKVKIANKIDGAIVIPERSNHGKEILEIIAPVCLRDKLKLKDGSKLIVDFY